MSLFEARDVALHYNNSSGNIIENLSMSIDQGEFICLLGPSGCGKTTIMRAFAGFLQPSKGELLFDNQPILAPGPERAVVFQDDATFPWLSVQENLSYPLKMKKLQKASRNKRILETAKLVRLEASLAKWPRELSGGMRKRLDIGRALISSPKAILMDEPFGALDVATKERLQMDLSQIVSDSGATVVFVTHDPEEALFLGDRVIVLGGNPSRIITEIQSGFERPRSSELKLSAEFQSLRKKLVEELMSVGGWV